MTTRYRHYSKAGVLHLNLHRQFFAETKKTEYRARTPCWQHRLEGRHYDLIQFHNGYATEAPVILVRFRGLRR